MSRLTTGPETRPSLLIRLRNSRDDQAWAEFTALYEPVVYRMCKTRGMQDADAREVVQEVLMSVATAIGRFDIDSAGSFRGWLSRIARNATVDHFRRHKRSGSAEGAQALDQVPATEQLEEEFDRSRREQLFRWAAGLVRRRTGEVNWMAFWKTSVDGQSIAETAAELGISEGSVYVARCRILKRIRELVRDRLEE